MPSLPLVTTPTAIVHISPTGKSTPPGPSDQVTPSPPAESEPVHESMNSGSSSIPSSSHVEVGKVATPARELLTAPKSPSFYQRKSNPPSSKQSLPRFVFAGNYGTNP